ncbi:DUF2612 domain-containing protein [Vibrio lentus]|uniref:DUF2612 domain-containing protein n=1 Tax=Vibrio lentus TaxID=136468 RepID=UPI001D0479B6|nr:DUF2612 domain-containing protein [Vibrio lentus]MCB5464548.1 DUF2612 domain-containing protein [Vibrio lentus]MCC4849629.1 DUF2612 domain-containing protein [Vibrio lentus]
MAVRDLIEFWVSGRYRNAPVTIDWMEATLQPINELNDTYNKFTYNLAIADGVQLDFIGSLVVIPRLNVEKSVKFFGWEEQPDSGGFDVTPWYDPFTIGLEPLDDESYRTAIYLKIIKNTSDGTIEDSILSAVTLLGQQVELYEDIINDKMGFIYDDDLSVSTRKIMILYDLAVYPATSEFLGYQKRGSGIWEK